MSKVKFVIEYAGLQLLVLKNQSGEDVTPLKPISDLFGLSWEDQRKKVSNDAFRGKFMGTCTGDIPGADGQNRAQTCILLSRVAAYLMSINPSKVRGHGNDDGADYLEQKITEWADALHDYEQLGAAFNMNHAKAQQAMNKQRMQFAQMLGLKNKTADLSDRKAITHLMQQMAGELGIQYQPDLLDTTPGQGAN
jgi:hypothetical protein